MDAMPGYTNKNTTKIVLCEMLIVDELKALGTPRIKYSKAMDHTLIVEGLEAGVNPTELVIPDEVDGFPVVAIKAHAFDGNSSIQTLKIGNNISTIPTYAFGYMEALQTVTIGNGVKTIQGYAFDSCTNLQTLVLGSSVETIERGAFLNSFNLAEINIPDSVVIIGEDVFADNDGDGDNVVSRNGKITLGASVTEIGKRALSGLKITKTTNKIDYVGSADDPAIFYNGTIKEFDQIDLPDGEEWAGVTAKIYIKCTDGVTTVNSGLFPGDK
jgi:hypothetical protein